MSCKACGRPRTPDHDSTAPGLTMRHPYMPAHYEREPEPEPPAPPPRPGCTIGTPTDQCGGQVVAAMVVQTYRNAHDAWEGGSPEPGVVLLCRRHATEPMITAEFLDAGPPPGGWPQG